MTVSPTTVRFEVPDRQWRALATTRLAAGRLAVVVMWNPRSLAVGAQWWSSGLGLHFGPLCLSIGVVR